MSNFSVKTEKFVLKSGCWECLRCIVYKNDKIIGEYHRNYPSLFNTFYPFINHGIDYAFIGEEYNGFSIYRLDDFKKIYQINLKHFCPTDFYVEKRLINYYEDLDENEQIRVKSDESGLHGFFSGCYWGNEYETGLWEVNLKDLNKGIVTIKEREEIIASSVPLKNCINLRYNGEDNLQLGIVVDKEVKYNGII